MLQKTKVKKVINTQGFKMSVDSIDPLERYIEKVIVKVLKNVEADGMKTLMPHHIPVVQEDKKVKTGCTRCIKLKSQTLQWGEAVQEEVVKMAMKFSRRI
tara:strand:+ start:15158 stop:15457 length:300 start_codon:yes stop_codon:yes gene_type:complete